MIHGRSTITSTTCSFSEPLPCVARRVMLVFTLLLTMGLGAPARAQCGAGWLPYQDFPSSDAIVQSLLVLPDGDVVVGMGGQTLDTIVRLDPTTGVWSLLGGGIDGVVETLTLLPGGDVVAGGFFSRAGDVSLGSFPNGNIARYNITTGVWSALGSGTNGFVRALALLPNGDLIVGGNFTMAGGLTLGGSFPNGNIARYNPATGVWSALGGGTSGEVRAVVVLPTGDLVVGGSFDSAGGVSIGYGVARYNISTGVWSTLGGQLDGPVDSLIALPSGDVMVGGTFTTAGGETAIGIAKLNISSGVWSPLGTGLTESPFFQPGTAFAFAPLPDGDVLVGGRFSSAGEVDNTSNIARVNPTTGIWSALGSGVGVVSGEVYDLALLSGGEVLTGGDLNITAENGDSLGRLLLRYTSGAPAPFIEDQPQAMTACHSTPASFSVIAGETSPLAYAWRKDGTAINSLINPSAATNTLTLENVSGGDAGDYDCIVSSACGNATSNSATLTICVGDFNCDGGIDGSDIEAFFAEWIAGNAPADVNSDGGVDGSDVGAFFDRWVGGC